MPRSKSEKSNSVLSYAVSALIPLAALAVFYLLSGNQDIMERICSGFSAPVLTFLGRAFSHIPVTAMELFIILAGVCLIVFVWRLISALLTGSRPRILILFRYILVLAAILAWVWNGYCWLWNTGYYGYSFAQKAGLESGGMSVSELYNAAEFFLDNANTLSTQVSRDESGLFTGEFDDFADDYESIFLPLEEEFPFLAGVSTRPKGVYFSRIMSKTGFTGIYFFGETCINTDQPDWGIPDTIAHELAHQRGIHLEAECNFLGIAACVQSSDPEWRYSGYLSGLIHLMNALYSAAPDSWVELRGRFSPGLEADWLENSRYWQAAEGTVSKVTDKVYDTFLKINEQPSGLRSYGECVDTLVLWLKTSSYSPMCGDFAG